MPQIKKALRGVKVEVTHRGNMRRKYRISGLTLQATRELTYETLPHNFSVVFLLYLVLIFFAYCHQQLLIFHTVLKILKNSFPVDERGTTKSVVQYFQDTYGFTIQHTNLPCLQVGNTQRPNYLPMEVCISITIDMIIWCMK